ncbi:hydrolase [Thioalkalivibrio denitrificans]|uniref:Hydrolase n=1 Tax=Thioalkalivibrio denitrificans TaxID=108003 RepID=A0A1V3N8E9_9GAMM|nr:hydrolase [Thioalkalivibrio denitrificans]OOG21369.1 hydrolase [Thioalkalivibrio denitrificans]
MRVGADFRPAWWLPGPHLQTLIPNLLPRRGVRLRRERLELPDGDFLDLDWGPPRRGPVVVVLHGLEGSSRSPYAAGLIRRLAMAGYQGVVMHFRGCSGEPNRLPRAYSAGETADIAFVAGQLRTRLPDRSLGAIGVSLGGNALLRWLGEAGEAAPIDTAIAISVPFDLSQAALRMERGFSRVYQWYLVGRLKRAVASKCGRMPMPVDREKLPHLNDFRSFDDAVTAPLHGYRNVDDYYTRASSRQWLRGIRIPTLILHTENDPFMTPGVIPEAGELSDAIRLEVAAEGGHVGFMDSLGRRWLERRCVAWLEDTVGGS